MGVVAEEVDRVARPVDDVQNSGRKAGLERGREGGREGGREEGGQGRTSMAISARRRAAPGSFSEGLSR